MFGSDVERLMILALAFGFVRYHVQILDFIPSDLNDRGKIVGQVLTRDKDNKVRTSPVLFTEGRNVDLGSYAGTGCDLSINNQDHVLIACDSKALKRSDPSRYKEVNVGGDKRTACFLWSNGKATYVGSVYSAGRLHESDRFLAFRKFDGIEITQEIATVKNRRAAVSPTPLITPLGTTYKCHTGYSDINERGTMVGETDFGYAFSHAVVVERHGKVTDLHPKVNLHESWAASFINSKGDILGMHRFDSSVGGHSVCLWKNGELSEWPTEKPGVFSAFPFSFNDLDQAVGSGDLYVFAQTSSRIQSLEAKPPYEVHPVTHAVLWLDGKMFDLNDLTDAPSDCVLDRAFRISNKGWIVGTVVQDHKRMGFLLKPILE